ncbi:MAG: transcription termination/antitermination protein NusG [Chlamydiales bacterium]|nr:transcription termination/antitermination protein NusG [Chlamydiales bacterium]
MSNWFVVQVLSGHEKKAKKALEENRSNQGMLELVEEVLVPTENVAEVKAGERKVTEKRLWPGYILVRMTLTDESWMYVKDSTSVIDFLGGGKPEPLTQKEVDEILSELKDKKDEVVLKHQIEVGDSVKITDGVFVNFVGKVIEVNHDKGRISVMVSIFGRDTRVDDLEFWQVEEATDDAEI